MGTCFLHYLWKSFIMASKYRISVLMGIYNCASYLQEALDSLYAQTYQDFKIILCDDGSKDETLAIAKRNAVEHPNIVLIQNEHNIKLAATLNHCLEYADTEYIARMDGDDISVPERFQKQVEFLDAHLEFDFVSSPMIYFDEDGEWGAGRAIADPTVKDFQTGAAPFCHAPMMMRTDCLKSVGGYNISKSVERMEDYDLFSRLYIAGKKGGNLQEPLYKMRNDRNAFARRKVSDRFRSYLSASKLKKQLGLRFPYLTGIPDLMKAFIPNSLVYFIKTRKKK